MLKIKKKKTNFTLRLNTYENKSMTLSIFTKKFQFSYFLFIIIN